MVPQGYDLADRLLWETFSACPKVVRTPNAKFTLQTRHGDSLIGPSVHIMANDNSFIKTKLALEEIFYTTSLSV
jgi:hypothetical protein